MRLDLGAITDELAVELLGQYGQLIARIARGMPRVVALDDLLAVGHVALLEAYLTHSPSRTPLPQWIAVVVRRRLRHVCERARVRRRFEFSIEALGEWAEPRVNGFSSQDKILEARPAYDRLAELPPREQAVLAARIRGFTFSEIGQQLGLSRQRVHQHYEQAVRQLQQAVEGT